MVGMIFAAGFGTRLKPWTDSHPKALVPVGGVPSLARVIENMRRAGVERVVVNTHHMAEQIHSFIASQGYDDYVAVSHEPVILDTGGGLRKALHLLGAGPVLVHNADVATDLPLAKLIEAHSRSGHDATLLTAERRTSRFLLFGPHGTLCGYYRSETGKILPEEIPVDARPGGLQGRAFNGVHIIGTELLRALCDYAPLNAPFSITDFYRARSADSAIGHFDLPAQYRWFDVGSLASLQAANEFFSSEK